MSLQQLFTSRKPYNASTYVAHTGKLFYDEATGYLRLGDGVTPGGKQVGWIAATSTTAPLNPYEGELWYNPNSLELWAYHNGAFRGTINPATTSTLGGVKLGPGVVLNTDNQVIIDSTGLDFSFGDFQATTPPNGAARLSSIQPNQDIAIVSNGTGVINIVGDFHIHRTADYNPNTPDVDGAVFAVRSDGQIIMKVPLQDVTAGALEIVGNDTGLFMSPNQTGVILHVTGNSGLVSRNYFDANANYSLLVGRRYNGTQLAPTKVLNGEMFFRIAGQAATQATTETAVFQTFGPCQIDWVATEDQGPNNQGGELRFRATPNNTSSVAGGIIVATINATTGLTATKFNGPLTGNVTGTSTYATSLATARTINGVSFDGSININVANTQTLTIGSGLTGINYNGAAASTIALNTATLMTNAVTAVQAGTVTTAAQPAITSVGTLTSLSVANTATVSNLNVTYLETVGNINVNAGGMITTPAITINDGGIRQLGSTATVVLDFRTDSIVTFTQSNNATITIGNPTAGRTVKVIMVVGGTAYSLGLGVTSVQNATNGLTSMVAGGGAGINNNQCVILEYTCVAGTTASTYVAVTYK